MYQIQITQSLSIMNHFKIIDKHLETLKKECQELTEFHETYSKVQKEIIVLIKSLFEEPTFSKTKKGKEIKDKYHDKILSLLKKSNYTQLVVETHVPGIYDPPKLRSKKLPTIKKGSTNSAIAQKIKPKTLSPVKKITTTSNCVLEDSDEEDNSNLQNDLNLDTNSGINLKIRDIEELEEPTVSRLDLETEVDDSGDYYYCLETNKVYRGGDDLPEGIAKLVGNLDLKSGTLHLGVKQIQVV